MSLEEEIALRYPQFIELLNKFREKEKLGSGFQKVADRMGKGFSRGTLYRIVHPETHGKDQTSATRRDNLNAAIKRLNELMDQAPPSTPPVVISSPAPTPAKPTHPPGRFHVFSVYYWDSAAPPAIDGLKDYGAVVTGTLTVPVGFAGRSARLTLANETFKGTVWVNEYKTDHLDVSARFTSSGQPDLFMTIHVDDKKKVDFLNGAFVTAQANNHNPLHGAFYLLQQPEYAPVVLDKSKKTDETLVDKPDNTPPTGSDVDPDLEQKVRLSLYRQTQVLKHSKPSSLPDYVHKSHDVLKRNLANKTFVGYFLNTYDQSLERFLLKVDDDGRVFIKYHNHDPDSGLYRLYYDNIVWFAFNYEYQWRLYRYRMNFRKVKVDQTDWYLGIGSGSSKGGANLFMNRVAMVETTDSWDTAVPGEPIYVGGTNRQVLNDLFTEHPILREYLSGIPSTTIHDNERLSETPTLLRMAGLLNETPARLDDSIRGRYLLYSLSRMSESGGEEDEKFEIVKMPLLIRANGTAELNGDSRTYYGQASREGNKLVLRFDQRRELGDEGMTSAFITCYLKITTYRERISKYLVGTSTRFVSEMPEARIELLVKLAGNDKDASVETYAAYTVFSEPWSKLRETDKDTILYLAGRVNRILIPHDIGSKKPTRRQPFFRLVFAHAAQSQIGAAQPDLFIKYLYQAAHHSFAMEEKDERTLLTELKAAFDELMKNNLDKWSAELKAKTEQIRVYFDLFDESNPS